MSNKLFDILKWIVTVALPALTALYLTLSNIWGWPYAEAVGASATAVIACAATLLGLSSIQYHKKLNGGNNK